MVAPATQRQTRTTTVTIQEIVPRSHAHTTTVDVTTATQGLTVKAKVRQYAEWQDSDHL